METERWQDLNKLIARSGPLAPSDFEPSETVNYAALI
jgi:hypothetical protein